MTWTAHVPTPNGSRYLQQLCKHWGHKFETHATATEGRIAFPMGPIRMTADDHTLTIMLEPNDGADVEQFRKVVADHLDRFAFREAPLPFDWQAG